MAEEPQIVKNIMFTLSEIRSDDSVPKNIRLRIEGAVSCLGQEREECLNINEALQILDEISNDTNLPVYTRVEILNIISSLESVNANP